MLLAVFSDIHANLPALEAVLKDIQKHKPDLICCLGDLVNQNVWNREVIALIRSLNIPSLMGNHDQGISKGQHHFKFSFSSREEEAWGKEAIAYTLSQVTTADKAYLGSLPLDMRFNFDCADGPLDLLMVHGSPGDINKYVYHFTPAGELQALIENAGTRVLLMGHTHRPYHEILSAGLPDKNTFLHAVNVGSVGCPKDGNWYACYVLIQWDSGSHLLTRPEALKVTIHRVEYDIDTVIHTIQKSALPLFYAGRLIKY